MTEPWRLRTLNHERAMDWLITALCCAVLMAVISRLLVTKGEKMAKTRIYIVSDDEATHLVEASSAARAVRHLAKRFTVTVPNTKEVAALMAQGVRVEVADNAEPELDL